MKASLLNLKEEEINTEKELDDYEKQCEKLI